MFTSVGTSVAAVTLLVFTQISLARFDMQAAAVFSGHFDPQNGSIIAAQNGKVLWTFCSVVPETVRNEVQTFNVAYYVEPLDGSGPAKEVYRTRALSGGAEGTLFPDGTIVISAMNSLVWLEANKPPREESLPEIKGHTVYPVKLFADGVVAIEYDVGNFQNAWWIPIEDHGLQMKKRVLLDDAIDTSEVFFRSGKQIAWVNAAHSGQDTPKAKRQAPRFAVFTIETGRVSSSKIKIESGLHLAGFDGTHAVAPGVLIDPVSGKSSAFTLPGEVIALDGDTLYFRRDARDSGPRGIIKSFEVFSVDLGKPTAEARALTTVDLVKSHERSVRPESIRPESITVVCEKKIYFWDSEQWTEVVSGGGK